MVVTERRVLLSVTAVLGKRPTGVKRKKRGDIGLKGFY